MNNNFYSRIYIYLFFVVDSMIKFGRFLISTNTVPKYFPRRLSASSCIPDKKYNNIISNPRSISMAIFINDSKGIVIEDNEINIPTIPIKVKGLVVNPKFHLIPI